MIADKPDWFQSLDMKTIKFTPVRPEHAAYIYGLRINPRLNTHLSPPPASVEAQADWIRAYLQREASGVEYYFLIAKTPETPCGTVRLYDFRSDSFCWGSWILDESKTWSAAIESALLVYRIGFEYLGFQGSHFDVRRNNERVISFHKRFGAQVVKEDDVDVYFCLTRQDFAKASGKLQDLVLRGSK